MKLQTTTLKVLGDNVKGLETRVAALQSSSMSALIDSIKCLENKVVALNALPAAPLPLTAATAMDPSLPNCSQEAIQSAVLSTFNETEARAAKKRNVVVFGFPRSAARDSETLDFGKFCSDELHLNLTIERAYRIGKSDVTKPRPLVIRLVTEHDRSELLRNAKLLRHSASTQARTVFIKPDLTSLQQSENRHLVDQLRQQRTRHADKWFVIRHGRIVLVDKPTTSPQLVGLPTTPPTPVDLPTTTAPSVDLPPTAPKNS